MKKLFKTALINLSVIMLPSLSAIPCTRVVYTGLEDLIITGRTMDWKEDLKTNIYVFPRGIERRGGITDNCIKWKSKYGSVICSGYDIGSPDGMNEKGLCANLLFLEESEYERINEKRPVLSISLWEQYVLDNFATVEEAIRQLGKDEFVLNTGEIFCNLEPTQSIL